MVQAIAAIESDRQTFYKVAQPTRHLDSLRPHPDNPREDIDPEDPTIVEMAESIARHGIIEPLVITPDGMVIAGHRRRVAARVAAKRAKRPELLIVPVTIREIEPGAALELMLHENMQRQSLTPLEEARAMYAIMERKKLIVAELARELSVPPKEVIVRLAILKCEEQVQLLFGQEELPLSAAPWLARFLNAEKQIHYAGLLARRQITLTKLRETVNEAIAPASTVKQAEGETAGDIPSPRVRPSTNAPTVGSTLRQAGETTVPCRAEAMAALERALNGSHNGREKKRTITLFNFKAAIETVCCACGMEGKAEVCRSCPFPRIILGVIGRAD